MSCAGDVLEGRDLLKNQLKSYTVKVGAPKRKEYQNIFF